MMLDGQCCFNAKPTRRDQNRPYYYTYVLNNPLKFTDPSGYSYQKFLEAEALNDYNPQADWWYDYMNTGAGSGRLNPNPGSHNNIGKYVRNPGPVGFGEDANGNRVTLYEDPVTGQSYYNVEYETDWYNESTNADGVKVYEYMYTTSGSTKRVLSSASNDGEDPWAATLTFAVAASIADGPIPLGEVLGIAAIGATLIKQSIKRSQGGNPNYPGPWSTDRPNNYIPPPVPGFNNRNYFPNGNGNDFIKWTIRLGGAAVLGKRLYEAFSLDGQYFVVPQDNTYVQPTPFLTPIPDPNKGY